MFDPVVGFDSHWHIVFAFIFPVKYCGCFCTSRIVDSARLKLLKWVLCVFVCSQIAFVFLGISWKIPFDVDYCVECFIAFELRLSAVDVLQIWARLIRPLLSLANVQFAQVQAFKRKRKNMSEWQRIWEWLCNKLNCNSKRLNFICFDELFCFDALLCYSCRHEFALWLL